MIIGEHEEHKSVHLQKYNYDYKYWTRILITRLTSMQSLVRELFAPDHPQTLNSH